jgi:ankyrin repeat protein
MFDLKSSTPPDQPDRSPSQDESEQERERQRKKGLRLKRFAIPLAVMAVLSWLMMSWASTVARNTPSAEGGALYNILSWSLVVCAILFTGLWFVVYRKGRRFLAISAHDLLAQDSRPPVVYLRSFKDDRQAGRPLRFFRISNLRSLFHPAAAWSESLYVFDSRSEEEVMAEVLHQVGPVVAIGRPGEELPQLGAARVYVGDSEWQLKVHDFFATAGLVALRIGGTPGFWWEVEQSAKKIDPVRLVLLVPFKRKQYEFFRERASSHFPRGLPEYRSSLFRRVLGARFLGWVRGIIYFKPDWTPVYVDFARVKWPWKYKLRMLGRRTVFSVYDWALQPVYQQLGVEWKPPRLRAGVLLFKSVPLVLALFLLVAAVSIFRFYMMPGHSAQSSSDVVSTASPAKEPAAQPQPLRDIDRDLLDESQRDEPARVRQLLKQGANIEAKNELGKTPLFLATSSQLTSTVKVLLDGGANTEVKGEEGSTPLILTAIFGDAAIMKLLLNKGANIEARDSSGRTPLIMAAYYASEDDLNGSHQVEVVNILLNAGAKIDAKDLDGETAMMTAAEMGHTQVVKVLLQRGADPNAKDTIGRTALDLANYGKHPAVVQLLEHAKH